MERRLILAVLLMSATIYISNILFPPPEPTPPPGEDAASERVAPPPEAAPRPWIVPPPVVDAGPGDTVVVASELYRYAFSTRGAALVDAALLEYPSYTREGPVHLVPAGTADFLSHRLVVGGDTIDLSTIGFSVDRPELRVGDGPADRALTFRGVTPTGLEILLTYSFSPDDYGIEMDGEISGLPESGAVLLTDMEPGLAPHEAPDHRSEQQLAIVSHGDDRVERLRMRGLEGTVPVGRRLTWVGMKDKYFLAAVIAGDERPFEAASASELPPAPLVYPGQSDTVAVPQALLVAALPVGADGRFQLLAYLGPQEFDRLRAVGYDLENVTQYAYRWLEPVIRPVAAAALWVLETMHGVLGVAYGWVLVLFGVMMRIVLWPLNAKAMRAQLKNMAVQPLMQEIREKYKDQPEKQQAELIKLYKEHGFNPLAGCLPMLIPIPVLVTLFFVFQNTIAFRGAEFLWLPDLSLRDPLYLLPLFLVGSMFLLQLISARLSGMEQNPQMRMMMYVMPVMMGVLFFSLPAGLNLYYATTNLASIPQQVMIARERKRSMAALKTNPPGKPPRKSGARSRR